MLLPEQRRPCAGVGDRRTQRHSRVIVPPEEAKSLANTLDADKALRYRARLPKNAAPSGVLVFVKPTDSGELPEMARGARQKNLSWIAADDFGNEDRARSAFWRRSRRLKLIAEHHDDRCEARLHGRHVGWRAHREPDHHAFSATLHGRDVYRRREFLDGGRRTAAAAHRREPLRVHHRQAGFQSSRNEDASTRAIRRQALRNSLLMDLPAFGHEYPMPNNSGKPSTSSTRVSVRASTSA